MIKVILIIALILAALIAFDLLFVGFLYTPLTIIRAIWKSR
jgi:hypothetical protein